jgi:putative transposase
MLVGIRLGAQPVPHRKRVRHFHEKGHLHEFTFSCYRRLPLLGSHDWCQRFARVIDAANEELHVQLVAFVFMPEHVHLLAFPIDPDTTIGLYLARIKQPFSKEIKRILSANGDPMLHTLTVRERPDKMCFRFWQEGSGFDRNLFNPRAIEASIHYIHENPVRRGLCERATDWHWSSARFYRADAPAAREADLPCIHGIPHALFS